MKKQGFDSNIAEEVGVNAAIIARQIFFWSQVDKGRYASEHAGLYWVKRSLNQMVEAHPYLTKKQIRTAIEKLVSKGIVLSEKWDAIFGDVTNFYTISEDWIGEFSPISMEEKYAK